MDVLVPILSWAAFILLFEGILWTLFRRKFTQICLPTGDRTIFHFFTLWRLCLVIALHTAFLLLTIIIGHLLLWP